jgi:hypothetical protein
MQPAGTDASGSPDAFPAGPSTTASSAAAASAGSSTDAFGNSPLQTVAGTFAQDLLNAVQSYASQNASAAAAGPTVTTIA